MTTHQGETFRYSQHERRFVAVNIINDSLRGKNTHTWKDQILGVIRISRREGRAMYSNLFRVRRTLLEVLHGSKRGRLRRPVFQFGNTLT